MLAEVIHGDCVDILKTFDSDTIDLIYADPPFTSGGVRKNEGYEFRDYDNLDDFNDKFRKVLQECHRILKDTGAIYIHSDPSFDFAVRLLLDEVFGSKNFRNQIIWAYAVVGTSPRGAYHRKHDVIYYFSKSRDVTYNRQYTPYREEYKKMWKPDENGRPHRQFGYAKDGTPRIYYLDEMKGLPVPSYWTDIHSFQTITQSKERTGYPTQKPIKLLERIVLASSNEGDVVLDPFCGSGTTLDAAKTHGRQFIGIDKNIDAVNISRERLGC